MSQQVAETQALGSEFISNLFGTSQDELAHYGVKGMKWDKHKKQDDSKYDVSKRPEGDTPEEFLARQKMLDEFLKSKGKGDGKTTAKGKGGGKTTAKGKGGGKGGGGKGKKGGGKGGAKGKAGGKKKAKKSSSGSSKSTVSSTSSSTTTTTKPKSSYAARRAVTKIDTSVREVMKAVSPRAQQIIDEINANVAARKAAAEAQHSAVTEQKEHSTMTDTLSHLDISTEAREKAAERDEALPDGSYPIRNKGDLARAIQSFGRASDKVKVKRWIIKRARELDAVDMLPDSWDVDDEIEHTMSLGAEFIDALFGEDNVLMHYGVLGMKWGVRNDRRSEGRPQGAASRKKAPLSSVRKMVKPKPKAPVETKTEGKKESKGTSSTPQQTRQQETASRSNGPMTDQELRDAINRMQMEKTYKQLLAEQNAVPKKPESIIKTVLRDSAKQAAGQILTQTVTQVGKYAIAAAISKSNPTLANAIMKTGDGNQKKQNDSGSDKPTSSKSKKSSDSGQNGSGSKPSSSSSSSSSSKNPLDLGGSSPSSSPAQNKAVEDAYARAYGNFSSTTKQILNDLEELRK